MKWEYKVVEIQGEDGVSLSEILNEFGEDHWRLVCCDLYENLFIFERLKVVLFEELKQEFAKHNLAVAEQTRTND